ncbi:MAG: inorganic diphosphatase [Christensenellaceae bacterium]|jgi:inorganic pyrophosphatase|nr:inorganic diphosphatase [Christensenellaceae bacterium]
MNLWHDVDSERITNRDFLAVIEISKGSKNKYEMDKATGALILDRVLYTSTHYPANYGFIPLTLSDDHDPLDVLVLCSEPIVPMALVRCYPIGVISMSDGGELDHKIIAIPITEPLWNGYKDIQELPPHIMNEITHFFNVYKQLEHKNTSILEVMDAKSAEIIIKENIHRYLAAFDTKKKKKTSK